MDQEQTLCIVLNGSDIDDAYGLAQDYAIASTTLMVGIRLWGAHGMAGVRRLQVLNDSRGRLGFRTFVDARLLGTGPELADIIRELYQQGVMGVTIAASSGATAMHAAAAAAKEVTKLQSTEFTLLAFTVPDIVKVRNRNTTYRDARVRRLAYASMQGDIRRCLIQPIDWQPLRQMFPELKLCVYADRAMVDTGRSGGRTVAEWFSAGANTVVYDPTVLCDRYQADEDADKLQRTMAMVYKGKKKVTTTHLLSALSDGL